MELNEKLANLGLKNKEIKAYLAILKLQKANPHKIAEEANIERTTIYKILDDLTARGLISRSVSGKRLNYIAEAPEMLKNMLDEQQSTVKQILPYLNALRGSRGAKPVIKFYSGRDDIRKILTTSLNSKEKIRRDFTFVENVVDLFGLKFIHKQIESRVKKGIHVQSLRRAIQNKKVSEKDWYLKKNNKELLREVRYLPESINFEPLIIIYDHTVVIISSKKESYALIIESPEFSQAMKTLFDIAWQSAKK